MRRLRGLIAGALLLAASPGAGACSPRTGTLSSRCARRSTRARSACRTSSSSRSRSRAATRRTRSRCRRSSTCDVRADRSSRPRSRSSTGACRSRGRLSYVLQPRAVGKAEIGAVAGGRAVDRADRGRCGGGGDPPERAAAPGPVRSRSVGRPLRGHVRSAPARPQRDAARADGGAAVADSPARRRAARAHVLALHADFGRGPPVQGGAAVRRLLGGGPRAREGVALAASRPRSRGRATGASRSCASCCSRRRPARSRSRRASSASASRAPASSTRAARSSAPTKPVTITVDPLPDAPGFSGAVGHFKADGEPRPRHRSAGRGGDAALPCRGHGQPQVGRPRPRAPGQRGQGVPAPVEERPAHDGERRRAARAAWEFVVVPETSGAIEIQPLAFSYFDAGAGKIVSSETAPLTLKVAGRDRRCGRCRRRRVSRPPRARRGRCRCAPSSIATRAGRRGRGCSRASWGSRSSLHAGLIGLGMRGGGSYGSAHAASSRSVRAALRELERVAREPMSKEQAAALVEKALDEAVGGIADADDSERARAVRGAARRRALRALRAPARRLLGEGEGPRGARGRGGAPMGVSARGLLAVLLLAAASATAGPSEDRFREANDLVRAGDYPKGDRDLRRARARGRRERDALLELGPGRHRARGARRVALGASARPRARPGRPRRGARTWSACVRP